MIIFNLKIIFGKLL